MCNLSVVIALERFVGGQTWEGAITSRAFGLSSNHGPVPPCDGSEWMIDEKDKPLERVRLSLDVTPEMNRTLDALAAQTAGSKSDVLRRAIALMEVAVRAKKKGQAMGVIDEDDKLVTRIVAL